jgi:regulator of sigma E protease
LNSILISTAAFVVAIGVLVTVHEFGHFWVARKLGVKVLRFSVGFGKPLWSRRFGGRRHGTGGGSDPPGRLRENAG